MMEASLETLGLISLLVALGLIAGLRIALRPRRLVFYEWQAGLLFRDGVFVRLLAPGRH